MNVLRRSLAIAAALAFTAAATAAEIVGSGKSATEARAVSGFRAIAVSVPGKVELVQGGSESLSITADDNVLPHIETVVEKGSLAIRFRGRGRANVRTKTHIRIAVSARAMEAISIAGAADVDARNLATPRLKVDIAGSGSARLAGHADSLEVNVSGSGDVKAGRLDVQRGKIAIAGSGDAEVWARSELTASIAGSGDVRYYGDPAVRKSVAGSGSVRRIGAAPG